MNVWRARIVLWFFHLLFWSWFTVGIVWMVFAVTTQSDLRFLAWFLPSFFGIMFTREFVGLLIYDLGIAGDDNKES